MVNVIRKWRGFLGVCTAFAVMLLVNMAYSDTPEYELIIKDRQFHPSVLEVPAGTKFKLIIENRDKTPEEFESYDLNREKIIRGGGKAIMFIGPLEEGEYTFFGEFNPDSAKGKIVARSGE